jgi:hypothetical protein
MEQIKHEIKIDNDNNGSTMQIKKISIKTIYLDIIKKLKFKKLLFLCINCSELLFTNEDISEIYLLDDEKEFSLIIDPKCVKKILNVRRNNQIEHIDKNLCQNDCLFESCLCVKCGFSVGSFIIGTTEEKECLINKIVFGLSNIISYVVEEFNVYEINLKSLIKMSENESEEIKEYVKLNKKMNDCFTYLNDKLSEIQDYRDIKHYLEQTECYADNMIRLAKYINYLKFKKKSIINNNMNNNNNNSN